MMNEKMTVQILQRTQHDLMNHLQVIQGYLAMDKIDIVKEKLDECINHYEQERRLFHTNAQRFILWTTQFNHHHENIQLIYRVDCDNLNLFQINQQLIEDSQWVVSMIKKYGSETELYEVKLELNKISDSKITLSFTIIDQFKALHSLTCCEYNQSVYVKQSGENIIYEFSYMIGEMG